MKTYTASSTSLAQRNEDECRMRISPRQHGRLNESPSDSAVTKSPLPPTPTRGDTTEFCSGGIPHVESESPKAETASPKLGQELEPARPSDPAPLASKQQIRRRRASFLPAHSSSVDTHGNEPDVNVMEPCYPQMPATQSTPTQRRKMSIKTERRPPDFIAPAPRKRTSLCGESSPYC